MFQLPEKSPFTVLMFTPELVRTLKDQPGLLAKIAKNVAIALAKKFHPDLRHGDPNLPAFEQIFTEINAAAALIGDSTKVQLLVEDFLARSQSGFSPSAAAHERKIKTMESDLSGLQRQAEQQAKQMDEIRRWLQSLVPQIYHWLLDSCFLGCSADYYPQQSHISLNTFSLIIVRQGEDMKAYMLGDNRRLYVSDEISLFLYKAGTGEQKLEKLLLEFRGETIRKCRERHARAEKSMGWLRQLGNFISTFSSGQLTEDRWKKVIVSRLASLYSNDPSALDYIKHVIERSDSFNNLQVMVRHYLHAQGIELKRIATFLRRTETGKPSAAELKKIVSLICNDENAVGLVTGSIVKGGPSLSKTLLGELAQGVEGSKMLLASPLVFSNLSPLLEVGRDLIVRTGCPFISMGELQIPLSNFGEIVKIHSLKDLIFPK